MTLPDPIGATITRLESAIARFDRERQQLETRRRKLQQEPQMDSALLGAALVERLAEVEENRMLAQPELRAIATALEDLDHRRAAAVVELESWRAEQRRAIAAAEVDAARAEIEAIGQDLEGLGEQVRAKLTRLRELHDQANPAFVAMQPDPRPKGENAGSGWIWTPRNLIAFSAVFLPKLEQSGDGYTLQAIAFDLFSDQRAIAQAELEKKRLAALLR
jgi:hypothetical protein